MNKAPKKNSERGKEGGEGRISENAGNRQLRSGEAKSLYAVQFEGRGEFP